MTTDCLPLDGVYDRLPSSRRCLRPTSFLSTVSTTDLRPLDGVLESVNSASPTAGAFPPSSNGPARGVERRGRAGPWATTRIRRGGSGPDSGP